ncbi:hypothetical protein ETB97_007156 [Aspergillus alliaceus]|uniref:RTA1 domain protein n=1 Tax=Petromyces alliaceus TaxID=209559 RepID=A0A8H6AEU0_PETAA|nr:hypothetical protein ETB97_007156 [Aspergillus burnettii]
MGLKQKCDLTIKDAQYPYCANGSAAIIFSVLFGITFIAHLTQAILYRKRFCWVIVVGSAWECLGLIMRTYSTLDQTKSTTAAAGQLLVLLAPLWINAFVYMIFGRMVYYFTPDKRVKRIKAESLAKIFIWLDIIAFIIQATGGIMASDFSNRMNAIGFHIYTAGIAVQEFFILCFCGLLVMFHRRMILGYGSIERGPQWKVMVICMYITLLCLTTRIIYRLVEFADTDKAGKLPLSTKEAPFYCLECVPIFCAMLLWNIFHPGRMMPGADSEFPKMSRKERKQMKREAKEAKKLGPGGTKYTPFSSDYHLTRNSDEGHGEMPTACSDGRYYNEARWPLNEMETGRGGYVR